MKSLILLGTLGVAVTVASLQAQAVPVNFDFTGNDSEFHQGNLTTFDRLAFGNEHVGNTTDGLVFDKGGLTLTVTGLAGANPAEVILDDSPDQGGLGVVSEGSSSLEQVNTATGETMILDFGGDLVSLSLMDFNSGAHNDCPDFGGSEGACGSFDLTVDNVLQGTFSALDGVDISAFSGSIFELTAVSPTGSSTAFYLGGLSASAVPEPGMLALMGLGILGLALARRKA